ncbi:MAG: hypothetical protein KC910_20215 [Candidatus Eremiobacteraeota bacterium]|nr:hypothetical protein [Candidatus Eremiobacteraeota bacterium]
MQVNNLPKDLNIRAMRKGPAQAEQTPTDPVDHFQAGGHDQIDWCIPTCMGSDTDKAKAGGHDQIDWCIPTCLGSDTNR